jgi:poly-beta-hydroxybutyrate-responsive repressor
MVKQDLQKKEKRCLYSLHRISKFIEPSILLFLSKGSSYGYDLIEKLRELGFHKESIDIGSVYRTLRTLEKEGFVRSAWQEAKSKRKKRYYNITPQGKILLEMWTERIKERKRALSRFMKIYQQD